MSTEKESVYFELEALGFPGYYDSLLWDSDNVVESLIDEMTWLYGRELVRNTIQQSDGALADLLYCEVDKERYMEETNAKYIEAYQHYLPLKTLEQESEVDMFRPIQYNYTSDRIFVQVSVEKEELQSLLDKSLASPKFETFIKEHFTYRRKFISDYIIEPYMWNSIDQLDDLQKSYLVYFGALECIGEVTLKNVPSTKPEVILQRYILEDIEAGVTMADLCPGFYEKVEQASWAKELVASPEWQKERQKRLQEQVVAKQSPIVAEAEQKLGRGWKKELPDDPIQQQSRGFKL